MAASPHGASKPAVGSAAKSGPGGAWPDQVVALAILPHAHHHMPHILSPASDRTQQGKLAARSGMGAAASMSAGSGGIHSSAAEREISLDTSVNTQMHSSPLWLLPFSLLGQADQRQTHPYHSASPAVRTGEGEASSGCTDMQLQDHSTALLLKLLSGTKSTICFDSQGIVPAAFLAHMWTALVAAVAILIYNAECFVFCTCLVAKSKLLRLCGSIWQQHHTGYAPSTHQNVCLP